MKNIRDILNELDIDHEPPTFSVEVPEWEEPSEPPKKWMTLGDLIGIFFAGGETLYNAALSVIFMCFWIVLVLLMVATLVKGCS